jgi:outer membrane protein assembly factor BamE (lipoprotein component of BamABCDE complex)
MRNRIPFLFLSFCLMACTPIVATHGNLVTKARYDQIVPLISTRADVARSWGPPTSISPFDPDTWYYIGETTSQQGIFEADVDKRQMIKVTFDPANGDTVLAMDTINPALARVIDPVDRRTPTAGREFTVLQQFVGNLGKFNQAESEAK